MRFCVHPDWRRLPGRQRKAMFEPRIGHAPCSDLNGCCARFRAQRKCCMSGFPPIRGERLVKQFGRRASDAYTIGSRPAPALNDGRRPAIALGGDDAQDGAPVVRHTRTATAPKVNGTVPGWWEVDDVTGSAFSRQTSQICRKLRGERRVLSMLTQTVDVLRVVCVVARPYPIVFMVVIGFPPIRVQSARLESSRALGRDMLATCRTTAIAYWRTQTHCSSMRMASSGA